MSHTAECSLGVSRLKLPIGLGVSKKMKSMERTDVHTGGKTDSLRSLMQFEGQQVLCKAFSLEEPLAPNGVTRPLLWSLARPTKQTGK